jgi:hypothetical protein
MRSSVATLFMIGVVLGGANAAAEDLTGLEKRELYPLITDEGWQESVAEEPGLQKFGKEMRAMPTGMLKRWTGCWAGADGESEPPRSRNAGEVCLRAEGDTLDASFSWPAYGVSCTMKNADARFREGRIIFFTPPDGASCTGPEGTVFAKQVSHAEGGCTVESSKSLKCIVTVFRYGNLIYMFKPRGEGEAIPVSLGLSVVKQ